MDALLLKFPPTSVPHVYTLLTVEGLAETHPMESVPYLKQVLETMSATVKSARKDALKVNSEHKHQLFQHFSGPDSVPIISIFCAALIVDSGGLTRSCPRPVGEEVYFEQFN